VAEKKGSTSPVVGKKSFASKRKRRRLGRGRGRTQPCEERFFGVELEEGVPPFWGKRRTKETVVPQK